MARRARDIEANDTTIGGIQERDGNHDEVASI
jgi:hypothetical protein